MVKAMTKLISEAKAYEVLTEYYHHTEEAQHKALKEALSQVPEARQEEFEWCHDCKEYDQERHCCYRFTKTIRDTVEEIKSNRWTPCEDTPEIPEKEVLACDRHKNFLVGYLSYSHDQWLCESDECMMYDPVAWMPLSEP